MQFLDNFYVCQWPGSIPYLQVGILIGKRVHLLLQLKTSRFGHHHRPLDRNGIERGLVNAQMGDHKFGRSVPEPFR